MENIDQSIVIQNGSSTCKYGISGNDTPFIMPSVIGKPKHKSLMLGHGKQVYFGSQAIQKRGVLKLTYPIQRGQVKDMDALSLIWKQCYSNQNMQKFSQQTKSFLAETSFDNKAEKQKKIQIFFQQMNVPAFYLCNRGKLSLYGAGRTAGLSIHSGDQVTQYTAFQDGQLVSNGYINTFIGGKDVTEHLKNLFSNDLKMEFTSTKELQMLNQIKQRICYISLNPQKEKSQFHETAAPNDTTNKSIQFKLPDESVIKVNHQAFEAPQIMFNPKLFGQDAYGMPENIIHLANRVEQTDRIKRLLNNVVLAGGNTMFKNISQRLTDELIKLTPYKQVVRVIASLQRQNLSWIGGSILTSLSTFQNEWITKAEYQQYGPQIVHKKCNY